MIWDKMGCAPSPIRLFSLVRHAYHHNWLSFTVSFDLAGQSLRFPLREAYP